MSAATENLARALRIHALHMTHRARAAHIGSALSVIDIVAVLYGAVMNVDGTRAHWPLRDRFILSKGHACVAVYAALAECGFIARDVLLRYGADHSPLMNHISHRVRGVEFSTGSLGHGLPFGVGKALSAARQGAAWKTFVVMSDGEIAAGSNWEAMLLAAHHRLDSLITVVDYNKLQSLASVEETLGIEPLADKFAAFGWAVKHCDGHDHDALIDALGSAPWQPGRPSALIAHTTKGKGVSFMENRVEWHYRAPNADELGQALIELEHADA